MKTPEDIKKGLECCSDTDGFDGDCIKCPYKGELWCGDKTKIDALAYIRQLEATQPKWISVDERLPDDCIDVLVFTRIGYTSSISVAHALKGRWLSERIQLENVTWWMPLPEPPKENA